MTEATFQKLIPLMRTVPQGGFWLSCLHEPTLHPKFEHFLGLIPEDCRSKCWFTTNLAKPLSEAQFVAWAESGLEHINISFDTLNPEIFAVVRKFGRYEVFERNLNALVKVFRRYPNPPKIRYITVVMKCNLEEVPNIIERTHKEWLSSENEIRYTYNVEHFSDEFRKEFFLSPQDWERLTGLLKAVPYHHVVAYPPLEDYFEKILPPANYFEIQKFIGDPRKPLDKLPRPLQLRFRPDGSIVVANLERSFRINANDLEDPVAYFRNALE
jgi:MoaA/NifB/PqqE/SkfB family radical SAM enzyme